MKHVSLKTTPIDTPTSPMDTLPGLPICHILYVSISREGGREGGRECIRKERRKESGGGAYCMCRKKDGEIATVLP